MLTNVSTALLVSAVLGALVAPAHASVVFQTATADPNALAADNTLVLQGDGTTQGNGFAGGSFFVGADFTVSAATRVTGIGAAFANTADTAGGGAIFGAIVQVDPMTGLPLQPVETLASVTLGNVVFTPTVDGDTTAALSVVLGPGTYGVVFGSGLFGADGVADLLLGNDPVGSASVFENDFAPFAADPSDTDARLFVDGVPAPEPGSFALLGAGTVLIGMAARRRR
jgi:hypothetical protein